MISNITEQLKFKQLRLEKHKSLKEYGKCDAISGEIRTLLKEQKVQEKQLKLMEKKEEKSKWYHKQKKVQKTAADKKTKGKSLMEMWRSDSSCSLDSNPNDSDETVHNILSSDSELNIVSDVSLLVQSKVDEPNSQSQMADVEVISGNESDDLFSCSQQVVNQSRLNQLNQQALWFPPRIFHYLPSHPIET